MKPRRIRSPYFWEEAPFLRPVLAVIAGILLYEALPQLRVPALLLVLAPVCLITFAVCGLRRDPGLLATALNRLLAPIAFLAIALLACAVQDPALRPGFPAEPPQGPTVAVVASPARVFESGQSFAIQLIGAGTGSLTAGGRIVCYNDSSGAPTLHEGDTLLLRGSWEHFRANGNPFEYDLGTAMRRKGIHFRMQTGASAVVLLARQAPGAQGLLQRIHDDCARRLHRFIPDRAALGLIQAMLLGDEAGFDPALRGLYADTGIIHIVSISGSHVAMLFAVIAALLHWIPGDRGAWIRYGTGLLLVWLYVLVAGAPPSALRSAVMFSVVALSTLSKREGRGLNTLCSAAFILLLSEPAWLFAPGFQLSFAAVLSLMIIYQPLQRLVHTKYKPLRWLWQVVCASIAAEVLTAPIVALYFHSFPLMFIPANILAGLVIGGGGLIGGMLVIVLSPVPPLALGLGKLLGWMLQLTNGGLSVLQKLSPEKLRHLYLSATGFMLIMAITTLFAIAWLRKSRRAGLAGMCGLAMLLAMNVYDAAVQLRQQRLIAYSNGRQALVDCIYGNAHSSLVGARSEYNAGAARDAWAAWQPSGYRQGCALFQFAGRRILILNDSLLRKPKGRLRVDVLLLTQAARRLRIDSALQCFSPKDLVLAARVSDRRLRMWQDSCNARHISFHAVQTMGAWQAR